MRTSAAALAFLVAASSAPARALETATFRADSGHSGVYPSGAGPALAKVLWSFPTQGPVRGSPAVAGDAVYFGSGDGHLYAVDASSGRERWRASLGGAVASSPAVSDGTVFATSRERFVTALDLATGAVLWRFEAGPDLPFAWGWDFWLSSPAVSGGKVYVGSGDGRLYALDARTGRPVWSAATGGRVRSSPAVADGVVYVGSMDGRLYALDAATGERRWVFEAEGASLDSKKFGFDRTSIVSSPAVSCRLRLRWIARRPPLRGGPDERASALELRPQGRLHGRPSRRSAGCSAHPRSPGIGSLSGAPMADSSRPCTPAPEKRSGASRLRRTSCRPRPSRAGSSISAARTATSSPST